MNAVFTYSQEMATQIGNGGQYVTTSGGYDLKIVRAQFVNGKALELDFETREGLKLNYVSINYTKNDGQPNEFGQKMIHAIMGCCGANQLTQDANGNIPELFGKLIKAVVQRVDYTKTSGANAGQDGYKFDFKMPAMMSTGQTIKEYVDQRSKLSHSISTQAQLKIKTIARIKALAVVLEINLTQMSQMILMTRHSN